MSRPSDTPTYLHGFSSTEQARLLEATLFNQIDYSGARRLLEVGSGVGAKLGNLLLAGGFRDVHTEIKTLHLDNREPGRRKTMIGFWEDVLLSAADQLLGAGAVTADTVESMRGELAQVHSDPNAVFFYSFVQARATVY